MHAQCSYRRNVTTGDGLATLAFALVCITWLYLANR